MIYALFITLLPWEWRSTNYRMNRIAHVKLQNNKQTINHYCNYLKNEDLCGINHFVANGSTCFNKGLIKMSLWKFMVRDPIGHGNLNVTICFIHERSFKILLTYGAQLNKKWNISCRCGLHGINWKLTKKRTNHRESKFLKHYFTMRIILKYLANLRL